ncbi:MAG TPA: hypothetical protein VJQ47_09755 [Steroidobacteraceae bacterium]|nr:hypothetical protein [Steroidobacteraceae bacterium]
MTVSYPDSVPGDYLGVAFPPTIEKLREQGAEFLTNAFRAAGSIASTNRVLQVREATEFYGGGMGRKLLLEVAYAEPAPHLHTRLFVKFQRDFGDPLRELFGPLMASEVRLALLSRREGFPITVPKCYFADYDAASTSGILITERIAYGTANIERCHEKCVDYELPRPFEHYQALTCAVARLAGAHKAGKFGTEVEEAFPFDPEAIDVGARIPYTPEQLTQKVEKLRRFSEVAPQLLPAELRSADFLAAFAEEVQLVLEHELAIRHYLNHDPRYIALCHWNLNVDNSWFWSDERGLHAGLLDWGSVGQMCVAQALYGLTCSAEGPFLNAHRGDLLDLFVSEYAASGGPRLDVGELGFLYKLSVAVLGIAWILDAPTLVETQIADFKQLEGRRDPRLRNDFLARAQLQILTVMLNEWLHFGVGTALRRFARELGRP